MKTYTLLRYNDAIELTADELLAEMERVEKFGWHIEQVKGDFWGDDCFMLCYW